MIPALSLATAYLSAGPVEGWQVMRARAVALLWFVLGLALVVLPWADGNPMIAMLPGWVSVVGAVMLLGGAWLWLGREGGRQVMVVAAATAIGVVLLHLALLPLRPAFDFEAFATRIGELQHEGHPIAFVGKYHDEYHFHGRLEQSVTVLGNPAAAGGFCTASPRGIVVQRTKGAVPAEALASTRFRSKHDVALPCSALGRADSS